MAKPHVRLVSATAEADTGPDDGPFEATPEVLEACFLRWANYVGAVGLKILGSRDDIDDLVQDVFVEAVGGLHSLRDAAAVKAWLATVTVRLARERLRRRRIYSFFVRTVPEYLDAADPAATPEERVLVSQVYEVLDTLPVEDRIAWALRYLEGEDLQRVALLTGCSLATAKRRIRRAHDAIREAC